MYIHSVVNNCYRKKLRGKHSVLGVSLAEETFPGTQYVKTGESVNIGLNEDFTSSDSIDINSSINTLCKHYKLHLCNQGHNESD